MLSPRLKTVKRGKFLLSKATLIMYAKPSHSYRDKPKVDIVIADSGALPVDVVEHAEL